MIESDQSDKDNLNDSLDSNEHTKKRLREDSSDDDNAHSSPKKLCTLDDKITFEETKLERKSEINGSVTNIKEDTSIAEGGAKDTDISNSTQDAKDANISSSKEDVRRCTDATEETLCSTKSKNQNKEISTINNIKETETEKLSTTDNEYKDSIPVESETNANTKEAIAKNEDAKADEMNSSKPRKKRDKSQIEDTEVVEGLELSVECASDKESSSSESESENEKDKKPKPKTIIIKAKPNDSELDVSTSEAEKSDLQDSSEVKPKQSTKKGKRKARTSFSKPTTDDGDSEENDDDDVSDEDYSPRTKRKLKKTQANKRKSSSSSASELKGSHDRAKQIDEKVVEEEEEEEEEEKKKKKKKKKGKEEEEEDSDTIDDKNTEQVSDTKKLKPSGKRIELLKKYIRAAGVRVSSYNTIWAGCKSNAAKIRCLEELLKKNGVSGRPTLEKCKKAKDRNERLKDIAELNTSNIISEGRVTRAQRKREETPTEHRRQARSALKRVLRVVDSDSE
ncbi:uncharacterized protein LOC143207258 [Lasioglossum baleicum]|uniref:uncharacterized protein LOC143207258 n=1 Tax=Lasioglossum baleicum TaxID=434251 RepID=UPI003FCDA6C4